MNALLSEIPNLVGEDTPDGEDEEDEPGRPSLGHAPFFDFEPRPHWEIGEQLGIIDIERAAAMSGSRMYALRASRCATPASVDRLVPRLARRNRIRGVLRPRHGPRGRHARVGPVAQVPRQPLPRRGRGLLLRAHGRGPADQSCTRTKSSPRTRLPIRYAAHTPCFRREKTSAGRDVRGIKRVHQFEKVEMYQFTTPETSAVALDEMLALGRNAAAGLELEYRVLQICSGDIGFSASVSYDLEIWAPGAQEWLEVSSVSNCTDFQARRANIRYRPSEKKGTRFVHTLNGSGLALPRTIAALLENGQQEDGSVILPEVLASRMGSRVIT